MRRFVSHICCLVAFASATFDFARAEEPIFVVQSSSSVRLLQVLQEIGLPDPIAAAGLDTKATLERMSKSVAINATAGGLIYVTPERPHLIVCLPLSNAGSFMTALEAFSKDSPALEFNGVYAVGKEDKFFAQQAGQMLLMCDSPEFLNDAATMLTAKPWPKISDDIKLSGNFQRLLAPAKAMLLEEVLSMTTVEPASTLYLSTESIREYLKYGLQKYLADSLFDCRAFELALNLPANGEIQLKLSTQEDTTPLRASSMFTHQVGANSMFALDFASQLTEANTQAALSWVTAWEKDLLGAIDNDSIQDKSDLDSAKRVVKFFAELVNQTVNGRKIDSFVSVGSNESDAYIAGGVALSDSAKVAGLLADALNAARPIGISYTDLKTNGQPSDAQADYLIDVPASLLTSSKNSDATTKLHVRIANQVLWIGVGNEGERLRTSVIKTADNGQSPMSLHCDFDSASSVDTMNVLPLNFRKLKLNVQVTDTGREYDVVLSDPGERAATPSVAAQAATN